MIQTISRNETFGKLIYDNKSFSPTYLSIEDYKKISDKITFDHKNVTEQRNDILTAPVRVYLDITSSCNLRCKHCLNESGVAHSNELSTQNWCNIIDGLAKDTVLDIKLTGGEPTLKKDWVRIAKKVKENNMFLTMNTNGQYSNRTIEQIISLNPDEISVSIDGITANKYIRGLNTDNSFNTVKKLHDAGIRVVINTVITTQLNMNEVEELLEFSQNYADDISFFPARPLGRATYHPELIPSYEQLAEFSRQTDKLKEKYSHLNIMVKNENLHRSHIDKNKFKLRSGSGDGLTRFNIMSNGDLFAGGCGLYVPTTRQELLLGNILQEQYSLKRIWHESAALDKFRDWTRSLSERCERCDEFMKQCSGYTTEMEIYKQVTGINPYCKVK